MTRVLVSGVERGDFWITHEFVGHMLRNSRGTTPRNFSLLDPMWGMLGTVSDTASCCSAALL